MPKRPTLPTAAPRAERPSASEPSAASPAGGPQKPESRKSERSQKQERSRKPERSRNPGSQKPERSQKSSRTDTRPTTRTVAPALAAPSGTGRWLRGIHFSAFSLVMMGILVLAVVILAPTLQAFAQQRAQIADQQAAVDALTSQVDAAKAQRARWNDPSYIRAQARDRLYYVMPGETSYLVVDDRPPAAAHADDAVSSKIQKTRTDWVGSLFGSFMGAGLTEATPQQLSGQSGTPTPNPTPTK